MTKMVLDCDPWAAWRALHSPAVMEEVYGPLLRMEPLHDLPTSTVPGDDIAVALNFAGLIPMGEQLIHISHRVVDEPHGTVRIMRDSGMPLTGPMSRLTVWDHQLAVSRAPGEDGKTLWRERLVFRGPTAAALWPSLWMVWQWRGRRIRRLARTWAYDPPVDEDDAA